MKQYIVTGMSCAACQARVEKAVSKVPGVTECAVSLLTNSMGVEGTADPRDVIAAVTRAGYGAKEKGSAGDTESGSAVQAGGASTAMDAAGTFAAEEDALKDRETPKMVKRLTSSIIFLLVLMYISMGSTMLHWWVPAFLENVAAKGVTEMLLAIIVMYINRKFFTSGFRTLFDGAPNMDTLVALGSTASFVYSLVELYIVLYAMDMGDMETVMKYGMNFYFETAAMIPTLITVGKMLEAMSKGRTTDALKSLMKLAPKTAVLKIDGVEKEVPISTVKVGDIFIVRPGENVPVDGIVTEGSTAVNESALTGESIPVDKTVGDLVSAATINQSGYIEARATRVGEDTTLSQIIHMVSDAAATKAPIARIADKVAGVFVPVVIGIAIFTLLVWLVTGHPFTFAIARAIAVLVIACPCALGLATPVAIMVGNGLGAKNGILYKTAASQEMAGRIGIVALDKTGTITAGMPVVTDVVPSSGVTEETLVSLAASLEGKSEHPLAKAILAYAEQEGYQKASDHGKSLYEVSDFQALPGNGLSARLDGAALTGGSGKYMAEHFEISDAMKTEADRLSGEGKTPLFFAKDAELLGVIAVADTIKEDSAQAVEELKNMGIEVVMITGDNAVTAQAIAREAGVDRVIAGVLPDGKEAVIRDLQKSGKKVAMVGDGINDAPALTRADLGIAIGAGADVALDAADVVLMKSKLTDVSGAIRLSRATIRNIHENLFWAFFYNVICIPLAAGFYSALFGWTFEMNPMVGAAAMSLSSFTVCMNALRLNLFKVHDASKDKKITFKTKETKEMKETVKINGMMCNHCEATVKKSLEALDGVDEAVVSHESGTAVLSLSKAVADEDIKKAITDKDYEFVGIEK